MLKFTNNASGRLLSDITSGQTSITLEAGHGAAFPSPTGGDTSRITLQNVDTGAIEICVLTARSADTLTVTRGAEGTTPVAFPSQFTVVQHRLTAGMLDVFGQIPYVSELATEETHTAGKSTAEVAVTPAGGVLTLDLALSNVFDVTVNQSITSIVISNAKSGQHLSVTFYHTGNNYSISGWPANWTWGGGAPTFSAGTGGADVVSAYYNTTRDKWRAVATVGFA